MTTSVQFLLILIASLTILTAVFSSNRKGELYLRSRTWLIIVVILLVVSLTSPWGWYAIDIVLLYLSSTEIWNACRDYSRWYVNFISPIYASVTLSLICQAGVIFCFSAEIGTALMLYFIFAVQSNDVLQYIFGKLFGRHSLAKNISPNKTIEGAVLGAIASAVISSLLASWLVPIAIPHVFMLGLLLAVAGTIGDLMISKFKRGRQIKDMGTLLPGHGGILDRIDSLLLSAPLFFIFLLLLKKSL